MVTFFIFKKSTLGFNISKVFSCWDVQSLISCISELHSRCNLNIPHLQTYQCDGAENSLALKFKMSRRSFQRGGWHYTKKKNRNVLDNYRNERESECLMKEGLKWSRCQRLCFCAEQKAPCERSRWKSSPAHQRFLYLTLKCKVCMFFSIFTSGMISVLGKTFTSLETRVHSQKHVVISPASKCIYRIGKIKCIDLSLM